jgi:regulator of sigma E protease
VSILSAIILLGILIFVHELGHFLFAKLSKVKVLKFSLGFGPRLIGKRIGETEYLISALPLGGYVKMLGEEPGEELSPKEKKRAFSEQSVLKRAFIVFAGPLFNILLAYVVFTGILASGLPINIPHVERMLPIIDKVEEGYPAEKAGLRAGDKVIKINNKEISTWFDMVEIVSQNPGRELLFTIKRGEETLQISIIPEAVQEKDMDGNPITIGRIGVRKLGSGMFETIEASSFWSTPIKGAVATCKMGLFIIDSIEMLITGKVSFKNLGGPITILKESGRAAEAGFLPYLFFMALLSVNLGILNLLPIPILDGGHLLLFGIEAMKGAPLREKTVIIINRVGYLLLILLMALALYNDFFRLFSRR